MPIASRQMVLCALVALALLASRAAHAASCTLSISNVAFGTVSNILSGANTAVTATVSISCSGGLGYALGGVTLCPNIGVGTGGATSSTREMANGSNLLNFQLYQDSAHTTVWGSYLWGYSAIPPTYKVGLDVLGSGSSSTTLYALLPGNQPAAVPLSYSSTFSGTDAQLGYQFCTLLSSCPPCSASMPGSTTASFTATATVSSYCSVSATNLNFGSVGPLISNVDATNSISVTCTNGTPWTASLNAGTGAGATVALRQMTGSGGATVNYTIYQNAARTQIWGDGTSGTSVLSGTGAGSPQGQTGYGRAPAQTTPPAGTYSDTVVVTLTY